MGVVFSPFFQFRFFEREESAYIQIFGEGAHLTKRHFNDGIFTKNLNVRATAFFGRFAYEYASRMEMLENF